MTSERDACAKLIDAQVTPLLQSGSLPPVWPWWLPLVDAISERLVAGRVTSERTADAEYREGMVTVRGEGLAYLGCMGVETWKWLLDHPEMDAPTLDRLVARNQQLQEALAQVVNLLYPHPGVPTSPLRALEVAQAALASVPTEATECCSRCRDAQEALERFEKALEHLRQVIELCDGCAPIDLQALADMGFPGPITAHQLANEIARRAALASAPTRIET